MNAHASERQYGEQEGQKVVDRPVQEQRHQHFRALAGRHRRHDGCLEDADAAGRVAGNSQQRGADDHQRQRRRGGEAIDWQQDVQGGDRSGHLRKGDDPVKQGGATL